MNALVIDSATNNLTIAAKKDDDSVSLSLNIAMKQSQKILPGIQTVLNELNLTPSELDYMALTSGPGTFTGLRLSFAALKAVSLSNNKPLYGIPSLDVYADPYCDFDGVVVSVLDAKKDQFFAAVYKNGNKIRADEDTTPQIIAEFLKNEKSILICGPDALIFKDELLKIDSNLNLIAYKEQSLSTGSLFSMAELKMQKNEPPMNDYDGPEYLRKSEAEIVLESKQNS